jgi:hypothetical protein
LWFSPIIIFAIRHFFTQCLVLLRRVFTVKEGDKNDHVLVVRWIVVVFRTQSARRA